MRSSFAILAVLLAATMAVAQAKPRPPQTQQSPYRGPRHLAHSLSRRHRAQLHLRALARRPPASGHKVLQAKSQDELKAYQDA